MTLHQKKKIEIVTDASVQEDVADVLRRRGASGYTLIPQVGGRGSRGIRDSGDIFGVFDNVLFIVVVAEELAEPLVEEVMTLLEGHPRMVLVSNVSVVRDDHF